ncbi:MAG: HAMP domain-containing histidine kinase [Elusimicrobia bacterium]|nr:HAMP domain-containing histidine kinase [Elusimicrobiota bacterium]
MTLQVRFGLWVGGVVVLAVAGHLVGLLTGDVRHLTRQAEQAHWTAAQHLAHACAEAGLNHDELTVFNFFKELRRSTDFVEAACLDSTGRVFLHSDRLSGAPGPTLPFPNNQIKKILTSKGRTAWSYSVPAERRGRRVAAGQIVYDSFETTRTVRLLLMQIVRRSLGITAITLLFSVGIAWVATRKLTRPIMELVRGARRLAMGDWSIRVREQAPGELGELAAEFNTMSHRLGELDQLKDQLMHTISHDLRNPLGAMTTLTKILKTDALPPSSFPVVEALEASIVRLEGFVSNILDSARLKDGPLSFNRTSVDLTKIFAEMDRLHRPMAEQSNKTLRFSVPSCPPTGLGDEEKIFRILLNLLTNAFKFTREGDLIEVSLRSASPDTVEIQVSDTGWGMGPDQIDHLFEPFRAAQRTPAQARSRQGSGLGLSIVKALVEGQGGTVRVESALGKGTRFSILLPSAVGGL